MKLQFFQRFQCLIILIIIFFLLSPISGHNCNITDTINRGTFFLSRCTFTQTQSQVTINITFVVLNSTNPYSFLADGIRHYLVYNNYQWIPIGQFKLDERNHKVGQIIQANMTMKYQTPLKDVNLLDWRSTLYCDDFYLCGTNTRYQIIMPWENNNQQIMQHLKSDRKFQETKQE